MDYQSIIDTYYPAGTALRDIYMRHCESVAAEALSIARRKSLPLSLDDIRAAAMLHDIGITATYAPGIGCRGAAPYLLHGTIGADMLRAMGVDERFARVAERHTGSGITADEIEAAAMPLPRRDFLPETLLERLICYADKFYSKSGSMERKDPAKVEAQMARFGEGSLRRFRELSAEFG